jgi:hypothetical protein
MTYIAMPHGTSLPTVGALNTVAPVV